jgi:multidrug efflux pump subunit AcrB
VLLGGLLISTLVTLVFVPALLSLMLDMQSGVGHWFRRREEQLDERAAEEVVPVEVPSRQRRPAQVTP